MKILAIIILLCCSFIAAVNKIDWDKTEVDFGKLKQGEKPETIFTFYNNSDTSLVLENVLASCGCTAVKWSKTPVLPRDSGKISIAFNTLNRSGRQNKIVTVYTNQGLYELGIKAFILRPGE